MINANNRYDKEPFIEVSEAIGHAWQGYDDIIDEIKRKIKERENRKTIIAIDCYHGVYDEEILTAFSKGIKPDLIVRAGDANYSYDEIEKMLNRNITQDRIFGVLSCHKLQEFFDDGKIMKLRRKIASIDSGLVLIYGVGSTLIDKADIIIYADMARWEIQLRMRRKEIGNWCAANEEEDFFRKYKRAFFIDWRAIDRYKTEVFKKMDYLLDTNVKQCPKMITSNVFFKGLSKAASQPFRLVPFFDPGPWGGQWMKEMCGLDKDIPNYAWCFDCVPEENSLYLKYGNIRVEVPSIDLVFCEPIKLLGDKVHARFGTEFPIRFDFLDTMGGGNLSLQVHPLTEYIQQNFGMHYTQDESYYILDAQDDAIVYLGLREGTDKNKMLGSLQKAQAGAGSIFDTEQYINKWKAKKHDHFLIPAGTIHCSGKNTMVLEISATPYIFTFKLWDWGRLGLDGKPRPIHLEHGEKNIEWSRETSWVKEKLINRVEKISEGDGFIEEKTGLHEREFIETRRHWFTKPVLHNTNNTVNVLNLIEGKTAVIESPTGIFKPFTVNYAETFVIPASVGEYIIRPINEEIGRMHGTIKAFVRS